MQGRMTARTLALLAGSALAQVALAQAAAQTPPPSPPAAQRACSAEANSRHLTGEARLDFLQECLGRRPTSAARPRPGTVAGNAAASFGTEAAAQAGCGEDTVVWGIGDARVFHLPGSRLYGRAPGGAFLCRSGAELAGYSAAR